MKEINSEQYLKRIDDEKDVLPESEIEATLTRLNTPLREVAYADKGEERVEAKDFAFTFSYTPLDTTEQSEDIERRLARNHVDRGADYAKPENWRKLKTLVFELKGGEQIDVFKKLPSDSEILFCPTNEEFHGSVAHPPVRIHILGNLATPRSVVTLLHEMGHVFDEENLKVLGVEDMMDSKLDANKAEKLRRERSASAFAFKAIKSVIPEGQLRTDARVFLKGYALTSYRESIKEDIAENARMSRFLMSEYDYWMGSPGEEEERQLWDDFVKWRTTEVYKKWKALPENISVSFEAGDEYGHWCQWVKQSGYDFYKDIYPEAGESL
ncbi:MAG: hypothetical protein Q7R64_04650 [bacterium]|nr:hypothetical protein [bacterium]